MIPFEVKSMENEEKQPEGYEPRPTWQVWAARVGAVLFVAAFVTLRKLKWNPILTMALCGALGLAVNLLLHGLP